MKKPEFSYNGYKKLIERLRDLDFSFMSYHDFEANKKPCILRHDVDTDIKKAADFAAFESTLGVKSTYFVLITTDFYNLMSSRGGQPFVKSIVESGHEVGLHFDELAYAEDSDVVANIKREAAILSEIIGQEVKTVSMHRPSKATLEANYEIPGLVNSYGEKFFKEFKYWSDSHMRWREDVYGLLAENRYDKIHLLTHPFWYAKEEEKSIDEMLRSFILRANGERYDSLNDNFTDLDEIVKRDEI